MSSGEDIDDLTKRFSKLQASKPHTNMEQLLQILVENLRAQQETNAALVQQHTTANRLKELEIQQLARAKPKAWEFIPKLGAKDDVEAYLYAFEATTTWEGWPKTQWVGLLAPFLSGESLKAFQDLETSVAQDYDQLKAEILSRHGITRFSLAQRFHTWTFRTGITPRAQMHDLI